MSNEWGYFQSVKMQWRETYGATFRTTGERLNCISQEFSGVKSQEGCNWLEPTCLIYPNGSQQNCDTKDRE
jgi:hypothetical protein